MKRIEEITKLMASKGIDGIGYADEYDLSLDIPEDGIAILQLLVIDGDILHVYIAILENGQVVEANNFPSDILEDALQQVEYLPYVN